MKKGMLIYAIGAVLAVCGFALTSFAGGIVAYLKITDAATAIVTGALPLGILYATVCFLLGIYIAAIGTMIIVHEITYVTIFDGIEGVISTKTIVPVETKNMPDEELTIQGANIYMEKHTNGYYRVFLKGDTDEAIPLDLPAKYTKWHPIDEGDEPHLTTFSGRFKVAYKFWWLKKTDGYCFQEVYTIYTPDRILISLDG